MGIAFTDYAASGGLIAAGVTKLDVSDVMSLVLLHDKTTLGLIKGRAASKALKHEWTESKLNPTEFTGTYNNSTHVLTISSPANTVDVQRIIRKYAIVRPEGQDFIIQFPSDPVTGANTVTVFDGTGASLSSAITFHMVSLPHSDEHGITHDINRPSIRRWNTTTIIERTLATTKTREIFELFGGNSGAADFKESIRHRTMEAKRELDTAVINSSPVTVTGSYTSDTEFHTMAGIIKLIRDADLDGTNEDVNVLDASAADITIDHINALAKKIYDQGGLDDESSPVLLMNQTQAVKLAAVNESLRRAKQADTTMGYHVNRVDTSLGVELPIIKDRNIPSDTIILLDTNKKRLKLVMPTNDNWALKPIPVANSRVTMFQLSGQFGLELRNAEEAHGLIRNLAT